MELLEQAKQWTALLTTFLNNGLIGAIVGSITAYVLTSKADKKTTRRKKEFINKSIINIKTDALVAIDSTNENKEKLKGPSDLTFKESIDIGLIKNIDLQIAAELTTHEISALNSISLHSDHYKEQALTFKNTELSSVKERITLMRANKSMCRHSAYIVIFCDLYLEDREFQYSFALSAEQYTSVEEEIFETFRIKYGKVIL
jgi:hypothetical protein